MKDLMLEIEDLEPRNLLSVGLIGFGVFVQTPNATISITSLKTGGSFLEVQTPGVSLLRDIGRPLL